MVGGESYQVDDKPKGLGNDKLNFDCFFLMNLSYDLYIIIIISY